MRLLRLALQPWLVGLSAFCGCATVDPRPDYRRLDERVAQSVGLMVVERPEDAAAVERVVADRLADGLTAREAMELCLLNNPRIRAAYLNVGVVRAEVVQAGLFRNPGLSIAMQMPDGGGLTNIEMSVAQNIADLWLLPVRKRRLEGELQRETLKVARTVGIAVLDTREAYFGALAADRELELAGQDRDLAQQLVDMAVASQHAGIGGEIDVNLARAELMETEISQRRAELTAFEARRRLAMLIGLATPPESLRLVDALPEAPAWSPTADQLLSVAETSRLDLVAARFVVAAAAARLEEEQLSVFGEVELGVSFERSERGRRGDRPWLADTLWASAEAGQLSAPSLRPREKLPTDTIIGPVLAVELPLFDQNQAQIARAEYLHEAALASQAALLLEVLQETRSALHRAQTAWDIARYYRDSFLPLVQTNLELSREAYGTGKLSVLAVLEAQKSLLAARRRYVEALRDGAVALTELEKAVGLPLERLVELPVSPTTQPARPGDGADGPAPGA